MSVKRSLPRAEEIGNLVPIGRIAKETPFSADFLLQLARSGKIRAFKFHRGWLTTSSAIREYLQNQAARHERELQAIHGAERGLSCPS